MVQKKIQQGHVMWQDVRPVHRQVIPLKKRKRFTFRIKKPALLLMTPKKIRSYLKRISKKQRVIMAVTFIVVLLGVTALLHFLPLRTQLSKPTEPQTQATQLVKGTPTYATVLPTGKSSNSLGGWTRVSPPSANPVFAYVDKIDTTSITVSEQPLPESFVGDTDAQVLHLAQSLNAREKFTIGSTTVYVGTTQQGSQRLFFTKNNLLILITTSVRMTNDSWAKYINTLQ